MVRRTVSTGGWEVFYQWQHHRTIVAWMFLKFACCKIKNYFWCQYKELVLQDVQNNNF